MIDDLYSARVLALAANMPRAGRLAAPQASAERIAKLCGSRVRVDLVMDGERVGDFAQDVQACALGQASAAVLGAHIVGATIGELQLARDALSAMLKSGGPPPGGRFQDLRVLQPVKDFPARHASTLLAFEAALAAAREAVSLDPARTSPAVAG